MRILQRFWADTSGALPIFFVVLFPLLMLIGGLATDVALLNAQKRYVQSQADLATLSATGHLPDVAKVRQAARLVVQRNLHYGQVTLADSDIRIGRYDPATGRFIPAVNQSVPEIASAVEVRVRSRFRPILLSPVLSDENVMITRSAVGTQRAMIAFSLRNRLLAVNTDRAILGRVLGPLGLGLNAQVLGYMGLASTRVSLNNLLGRIAGTSAGVDLMSFDQVLNLQVSRLTLLNHLVSLGGLANMDIVPASVPGGTVTMGEMIAASPTLLGLRLGDALPDIELNVFDMVMAMAGLAANPENRLAVALPVNLSPLANISLSLGLIRPPVTAVGFVDDQPPPRAEVSQVSTTLAADVLSVGSTALLRLTATLDAATANAVPRSLNCSASQPGDQLALFRVVTSPLNLSLQVGVLDSRSRVDPRSFPMTSLGGGTRDVAVTLGQFRARAAVPVPNPLVLSGVVADLNSFLRTTSSNLNTTVANCSGLLPLNCLISGLVNLTLSALLDVLSGIATALTQLVNLVGGDRILQAVLDLLGISVASADLVLDSYSCNPRLTL